MSHVLEFIDRGIGMVCRGMLYLTLSVVFVILSINVGLRYAAGTSLAWASELPELMFPWMIMSGVVLAAQHGSHIAVVILTQKLGKWRRPVLQAGADERTPILQVPGSVSVWSLILGFVFLAIVTLCRFPHICTDDAEHGGQQGEAA
jgi:TRAP-type transport system small permease protein